MSSGPPALASNPSPGEQLDGDVTGDQENPRGVTALASGGGSQAPKDTAQLAPSGAAARPPRLHLENNPSPALTSF